MNLDAIGKMRNYDLREAVKKWYFTVRQTVWGEGGRLIDTLLIDTPAGCYPCWLLLLLIDTPADCYPPWMLPNLY